MAPGWAQPRKAAQVSPISSMKAHSSPLGGLSNLSCHTFPGDWLYHNEVSMMFELYWLGGRPVVSLPKFPQGPHTLTHKSVQKDCAIRQIKATLLVVNLISDLFWR